MSPTPAALRGVDRLAALALFGCVALALVNLPEDDLPRPWVAAWTAPAALLALVRPWTRRFWQQAVVAVALQGGALAAMFAAAVPLSRPAALACTILPPMAFVAVRRRDADAALGLFLSFCVLLVGIILDGVDVALVAAYGVAACLCLRCDAHRAVRLASLSQRSALLPGAWTRKLLGAGSLVALLCLFAALTIERTLALLPSPTGVGAGSTDRQGSGPREGRSIGLGDSFVLDGGKGVLSDLHGEQLVRATMANGSVVPRDLYLRSGFFAVPGLDRWQLGGLDLVRDGDGEIELRRPLAPAAVQWLELERFAGARNFVFAPPATCTVRGVGDLVADPAREWLRQGNHGSLDLYELGFQQLPTPAADLPFDPRAARHGLLALPAGLDRAPFDALLARWDATGKPMQIAERIAAGLGGLCRYDRLEPSGPYAHALENFLFAPQDRHGYCMHFASAAALLLRLRGVPCRIGVGLYGGQIDRQDPAARLYGSQHAHAWVEIPFAGRGYVVFDPTPPAERGARMPTRPAMDDLPDERPSTERSVSEVLADFVAFATQPWLLGAVLLMAIAVVLRPGRGESQPAPTLPAAAKTARRLLAKTLRALAEAGLARARGQTLETYARDLAARDSLPAALQDAFSAYQEVRFGGRPFDSSREQRLLRGLHAAEGLLPAAGPAPGAAPAPA
jgi:transglutaminase-like putative cysteine protease